MVKLSLEMYYDCEWDNIEIPSHDIAFDFDTAFDSFPVEIFVVAIFAAIGILLSMFMLEL